jgi:hypothetical protein
MYRSSYLNLQVQCQFLEKNLFTPPTKKGKLTIALSSTKVEYQALTNASTEYIDMASILI